MHNEQLSDPLNKWSKAIREISGKRKKTDADLIEMSRREWYGGLYINENDEPLIPSRALERLLRDAATRSKRGKDVLSGIIVPDDAILNYGKHLSLKQMWDSGDYAIRASVKIGRQRVIRCRPIFHTWSLEFVAWNDEEIVNARDVEAFLELGGRLVGLCDWRPKHGRYTHEVVEAAHDL